MGDVMPPTIIVSEAARPEFEYSSAWSRSRRYGVCNIYEERYAATYGMFRLDRIRDITEPFRRFRSSREVGQVCSVGARRR